MGSHPTFTLSKHFISTYYILVSRRKYLSTNKVLLDHYFILKLDLRFSSYQIVKPKGSVLISSGKAKFHVGLDSLLLSTEFQTELLTIPNNIRYQEVRFEIQPGEETQQNPQEVLPFRLKFKWNSLQICFDLCTFDFKMRF